MTVNLPLSRLYEPKTQFSQSTKISPFFRKPSLTKTTRPHQEAEKTIAGADEGGEVAGGDCELGWGWDRSRHSRRVRPMPLQRNRRLRGRCWCRRLTGWWIWEMASVMRRRGCWWWWCTGSGWNGWDGFKRTRRLRVDLSGCGTRTCREQRIWWKFERRCRRSHPLGEEASSSSASSSYFSSASLPLPNSPSSCTFVLLKTLTFGLNLWRDKMTPYSATIAPCFFLFLLPPQILVLCLHVS